MDVEAVVRLILDPQRDVCEGEDLEVEAARIRKELSARPMLDDAPVAAEDDKPVPLAIRAPVDLDL